MIHSIVMLTSQGINTWCQAGVLGIASAHFSVTPMHGGWVDGVGRAGMDVGGQQVNEC